jgi:hypothetical protein
VSHLIDEGPRLVGAGVVHEDVDEATRGPTKGLGVQDATQHNALPHSTQHTAHITHQRRRRLLKVLELLSPYIMRASVACPQMHGHMCQQTSIDVRVHV